MQATKRTHGASVIGLLLDEPYRFEFTQLLNLLLRELRRQGIPYERAMRELLRFQNNLSLSFPASEVQALEVETDLPFPLAALRKGELKRIRITPAFIGLLGAGGTLPLHDTERIAAPKAHDGDAASAHCSTCCRTVWSGCSMKPRSSTGSSMASTSRARTACFRC